MQPKELVRAAFEGLDRSADGFADLMVDDAELVNPFGTTNGREAIREFMAGMHGPFSDWKHDLELFQDGDVVVVEGTWNATHSAPMPTPQGDVPATGTRVAVPFAGVVRVQGDAIVSAHYYYDMVGFMAQLGLGPSG